MIDNRQLFDPQRMNQYNVSRAATPFTPPGQDAPMGGEPQGMPEPQGFAPPTPPTAPTIGVPDVTDDELLEWVKTLEGDPNKEEDLNNAMWAARYAHIGMKVMKKHKMFKGSKAQERLLFEDMVLWMVEATDDDGNPVRSPIESKPEAVADFIKQCMKLRGATIKED